MESNFYLTEQHKSKYMLDFEKVRSSKFWPLDDGIESFLVNINSNSNIQTLYSKKCQCNNWADNKSYLEFCYSEKCEQIIFRKVIPELLFIFSKDDDKFLYSYSLPSRNANYKEGKQEVGIGCIDDKEYFLINHFKFEFFSEEKEKHDNFWIHISNTLSKISV